MRLIILTLGFDEKFAVRGILRYSPKAEDSVIVVTASPLTEKAEKALGTLREILQSYAGIESVEVFEVDVSRPEVSKQRLAGLISGYEGEVVANLSGGMRALILITLAALISSGKNALIEVETENLETVVTLSPEFFMREEVNSSDLRIIRMVHEQGGVRLDEFARTIGKSRTTTYRILRRLVERGYLTTEKFKRGVRYLASERGRALLEREGWG